MEDRRVVCCNGYAMHQFISNAITRSIVIDISFSEEKKNEDASYDSTQQVPLIMVSRNSSAFTTSFPAETKRWT